MTENGARVTVDATRAEEKIQKLQEKIEALRCGECGALPGEKHYRFCRERYGELEAE